MALAGAGVRILLKEQSGDGPYEWWEVPGGSRVLVVSVPDGGNPRALGFDLNQNELTGRVEDWLSSTALRFSPDDTIGTAVVVNSDADDALPTTLETVATWNARFAYPRVVVGNNTELFEEMEARTAGPAVTAPHAIHRPQTRTGHELVALAEARANHTVQRILDLGRVLGGAVEPGAPSLETVAAYVATAVAGTVVFNSSPYQHSDLARMSDGSERLATNVPGLGYAFFPDESVTGQASSWETIGQMYSAEGEQLHVAIDRVSGAITSLVQLTDGREWVRPDSDGLNSVQGARLLRVSAERLAGVATRLMVWRRAPNVGAFTSTLTLYDELPWLSLTNETESPNPQEVSYLFHLASSEPEISWEVPAGYDTAPVPVSLLEHLRWIRLADRDATLMFRGFDAPMASVDTEGTLTSHAPHGISRYRLAPLPLYSSQDMPWVFGWDSEPMATARVEPNGSDVLPRFGSMLTFEQVGVTVLGMQPASDGYGAIVYLQETLGVSRTVSVGPGILRFRNAETVDYLERYLEQVPLDSDGTIQLLLPASSAVAVRLSGLELS
jgi:hypothetical protein